MRNTWCVYDMAPGKEYAMDSSFVQLRQMGLLYADNVRIAMGYSLVRPGLGGSVGADEMARRIVLTRCEYRGAEWRIDLLSGKVSGCVQRPCGYSEGDWRIEDADGDGRRTFFDFRVDPLRNLPPPQFWMGQEQCPRMVMSVMFAEEAGNETMGAELEVKLAYTLTGC